MISLLKNIIKDEAGGECIEMALVTASVSICSVTSFQSLKHALNENMEHIAITMNSVFDQ